jgi:nucleotide-binding universal stress UspA family protein
MLCPVDFSEQSALALRYAAALGARSGAALRVMYSNDPFLVAAAAAALHDTRGAVCSQRELRSFVHEALGNSHKSNGRLDYQISTGDPAAEILTTARRCRSDLIVMGTHGLTGADRLLIGSTSLAVLRRTRIPILAVPRRSDPPASWPGQRIAVAVDVTSPSASADVNAAADLAAWFDASLLIIHVVGGIRPPAWLEAALTAHERIRLAEATRQLEGLAERVRARVQVDTRIASGHVADEVAAVVAGEGAGLLVTSIRDRKGWFGPAKGAISYHVLTHGVAPVLAHPPGWRPK